jgi:hypothetical protein
LPPGTVTADTWHHVAGVHFDGDVRVYLDGMRVFQTSAAQSPLPSSGGYLLVAQLWPNRAPLYNPQYLHGALDELAIWNAPLSEEDVLEIYANQKP